MTSFRHLALFIAAFLTSLRTLSPERLDNGTDFVFYLGRWFEVGALDVGATGQALAVFVILLGLELACAVVAVLAIPLTGFLVSAPSASHADIVISCSSDASICMKIGENITVMGEASIVVPDDTEK